MNRIEPLFSLFEGFGPPFKLAPAAPKFGALYSGQGVCYDFWYLVGAENRGDLLLSLVEIFLVRYEGAHTQREVDKGGAC